MESSASASLDPPSDSTGHIDEIPVRNLWLLMLYASELFQYSDQSRVDLEENPEDLPDLVAEILCEQIRLRLKRNLTVGYREHYATLTRVRGRIDVFNTERHRLLERGRVACRYEQLTLDTPRNRYVKTALTTIGKLVRRKSLAHQCRILANTLERLGVNTITINPLQAPRDRLGHHDAADRYMLAAAHLALNLALPTEMAGQSSLFSSQRNSVWVRRLYEKAVAGFYRVALTPLGWRVEAGKSLAWPVEEKTSQIHNILPGMRTDIILEHPDNKKRLVIDTKFTAILKSGWYRTETLSSHYLYQIYAYLRSQVGQGDSLADKASGLLLHPAVGAIVDERIRIQGHTIRFATVDLGSKAIEIRKQLLDIVLVSDNT